MSNIKKSERTESRLQVIHDGYKIRKNMMDELGRDFGYQEKDVIRRVEKFAEKNIPESNREEWIARKLEQELEFHKWFIKREREKVLEYASGIVNHLIEANTIYPVNRTEWEERRLDLDRALQCCQCLMQELQFIAETIPVNRDKYTNIVDEITSEFEKIKELRKSDNRLLKNIKE